MSKDRYAALFRKGVFLEVYVFSNKELLDKKVSLEGASQTNLGIVRFRSRKSPSRILEDFLSIYASSTFPNEVFETEGGGSVSYTREVEPVILQGFVNYFSRDINRGFRLWPFWD